jgi:hypothetical protein
LILEGGRFAVLTMMDSRVWGWIVQMNADITQVRRRGLRPFQWVYKDLPRGI